MCVNYPAAEITDQQSSFGIEFKFDFNDLSFYNLRLLQCQVDSYIMCAVHNEN